MHCQHYLAKNRKDNNLEDIIKNNNAPKDAADSPGYAEFIHDDERGAGGGGDADAADNHCHEGAEPDDKKGDADKYPRDYCLNETNDCGICAHLFQIVPGELFSHAKGNNAEKNKNKKHKRLQSRLVLWIRISDEK